MPREMTIAMPENQAPTDTDDSAESGVVVTPAPDDRKQLFAERDAAKKRAREAERKAEELAARVAEYEAKQAAEAEDVERKKNDFAAIEARLKAKAEKAEQAAAEALAKLEARDRREREAALVDAVSAKLGFGNRVVLKGVLKELAEQGVDTAPETLDNAADVAKQVRELLGDVLQPKAGIPGTPGVNLSTKKPSEKPGADPNRERVRGIAERLSIK
jgi:molecular chaperone GrpE (heat shock protein)